MTVLSQSTRFKPVRMLAAAVAVSMVFGLTACGSNSATNKDSQSVSNNSKDQQVKTVRIGYLNVMDDAQTILANEAGLYKKHGLNVEMKMFDSGTDLVKAIVGGQLDAGVLGFTNAITWLDKGADIKIVGGAQLGYHSMLVRNDSGIKSIADLKGHSIASQQQGSTADIVLNGVVLKKAGLSKNDVQMQYVSPSVAIQSLQAKKVDAAFVFEPYDHITRLTSPTTSIYEIGKDWPFPCMVVLTSGKAVKENQAAINQMLDAQKEAIEMLQKNPKEAAKFLTKQFIKDDSLKTSTGDSIPAEKVIEDSIKSQTFTWAITPEQELRMQEIVGMMVDQGILKKSFDVKKAVDLSWQEKIKK